MHREDLVCDVEYAEKLVELGVNRKSWFSYVKPFKEYNFEEDEFIYEDEYVAIENFTDSWIRHEGDKLPTFTTDELLEVLPKVIHKEKFVGYHITIHNHCGFYVEYTNYTQDNESYLVQKEDDDKLSNALAKLLIWCIENGYVEKESDEI